MPNFTKNPLFGSFGEWSRRQAREDWRRSDAYKLQREIQEALATPRRAMTSVNRFADLLGRFGRHGFSPGTIKMARGLEFKDMVREVVRYQMAGGESLRLVGELLGALGPLGRLIGSMIGPRVGIRRTGIDAEIESAVRFLQAYAPDKLAPQYRNVQSGVVSDSIESAIATLQAAGYEVTAPGAKPKRSLTDDPVTSAEQMFYPQGTPKTTKTGEARRIIELDVDGAPRRFPANHPIVTKEMVTDFSSSNVHGFSYDIDTSTLYVRYQAAERFGKGPGSLYAYSHVTPEKFLRMYNAPSKGTWLWDEVRIRGTWSGHRHDYRLVAIRNSYVPRKAVYVGGGVEEFQGRRVRVANRKTGKIRTLKSELPDEIAPPIPYGGPDRGRGDNGRRPPNRGR